MQARVNNIDTRAVNHLVATPQATHASAVCSSVGMALRTLLNTYYRGRLNLEDLNAPAYRAYTARITDGSEHVFLELPDNAAKRLIDTEYQICFNDFRERANTPQQLSALDSLDAQVKQPMFRDHHIINLYLPVRDAADAAYVDKIYVFPLKLVFTLVWKALRDHAKFTHNYTDGNDQAKLNKASAEYKDRLASLFRCIDDLVKNPICATGYRNELVFLLSQTYEGMELIESVLGTVALVLRHTVNHLFREKFAVATEQTQKRTLSSALLRWIGEADNTLLLPLLGSRSLYQMPLQTIFIKHAVNPQTMNLDKLINDALPTLNFAFGPEYPALKTLTAILQSFEVNAPPARSAALAAMQQWIYNNSVIDEKVEGVENFYKLYAAQKALQQHRLLLVTLGQMKAEFQTVAASCDEYFLDYVAAINSNNALPVVAQDVLATIELLNATITLCRENDLKNMIENFFGVWFAATTITDLKIPYAMLLDEDIQEKIILSDEQIDSYLALLGEPLPNGEAPEIVPYQINIVLLNGIIKKPQQWTDKFRDLFLLIMNFLHKNLNEHDQPNQHATTLRSSSYPGILRERLRYLYSVAIGEPIERPLGMLLLLPDQVETAQEWLHLAELVDEKIYDLYELHKVVLINRIKNSQHVPIFSLLMTIPKAARLSFLIETAQIGVLKAGIVSFVELLRFLNVLPEADRETFLTLLNIENFEEYVINKVLKVGQDTVPNSFQMEIIREQGICKTFITELSQLPKADKLAFITSKPCVTFLREYLVPEEFKDLIAILSPTDIPLFLTTNLVKALYERWCGLLRSPFQIVIQMQIPAEYLPGFLHVPEVKARMRDFFWEKKNAAIISEIKNAIFIMLYKCLKQEAREPLLKALGITFAVFFSTMAGVKKLLSTLPSEIKVEFLTTAPCSDLLIDYLKDDRLDMEIYGRTGHPKLREIMALLTESEQAEFIGGKFYAKYINSRLPPPYGGLSAQLEKYIPAEFQYYFVHGNIEYIKRQLTDFKTLKTLVFFVIPAAKRLTFLLQDLGVEFLKHVLGSPYDCMSDIVELLPSSDKLPFLKALAEQVAAYDQIWKVSKVINSLDQESEKLAFATELSRYTINLLVLLRFVPEVHRLTFVTAKIVEFKTLLQSADSTAFEVLVRLPVNDRTNFLKETLGVAFVVEKISDFADVREIIMCLPLENRKEIIFMPEILQCIKRMMMTYLYSNAPTARAGDPGAYFLNMLDVIPLDQLKNFFETLDLSSNQIIKILDKLKEDNNKNASIKLFIENIPTRLVETLVKDFLFTYQQLRTESNYGPLNWFKSDWVARMKLETLTPAAALTAIHFHRMIDPSRSRTAWLVMKNFANHEHALVINPPVPAEVGPRLG